MNTRLLREVEGCQRDTTVSTYMYVRRRSLKNDHSKSTRNNCDVMLLIYKYFCNSLEYSSRCHPNQSDIFLLAVYDYVSKFF